MMEEIRNKMTELNLLDEVFEFACFADGILTYTLDNGEASYEFNIVSNDIFKRCEKGSELTEKSAGYVDFSMHSVSTKREFLI